MSQIRLEWDEAKNRTNQRKHGLSFEDAAQVFSDPLYVSIPDRMHDGEERWKTFGMVRGVLLLLVVHTVQEENGFDLLMRIISARQADRRERRLYENETH